MYVGVVFLLTFLLYSHGSVIRPEQIPVTVQLGKRLKLSVENASNYLSLRWRFNNGPPSEKCEESKSESTNILICPNMDYSDAGMYEYQAIRKDGQKEVLLAVKAEVVACTDTMSQRQQDESSHCYCSGITDQCHMTQDLFKSQVVANVSEVDLVSLKITSETMNEFYDNGSEQESWTYFSLPEEFTGNLLNSYGGYLDFIVHDDNIDAGGPDVMLKGKDYALVYYNLRELASEELSRIKIKMTEKNWRLLNGEPPSKFIFMNVLSGVEAFYIKHSERLGPQNIVLDSAENTDRGLGKVDTVEQCECREGYKGMSCETCARGYRRRYAVGGHGICISVKEKLKALNADGEKWHQIKTLWKSIKNYE
ncbi:basement membrane-specific heparan sulfate proteoglycan core protein-like [Toxorhynchites rutilus septentrionalis]|uniref:basement membrane-specific heparan sulfate proteoglycan core protein-like n=1 Tax=Toxorhynchites rutilus septentrionalis TaxID=329112 RepID=UPI002478B1E6|nr:basement membrane-specific heparan sulfate proteoglycan core protein-like [Toxorhynchites rutilus septentrionalis]